ncbi:MAG TPA: 2-amino-4-hydroxy-6-hydroxymethyldihydropteridine diphosphokinase [Mycobacteriales bacterium]
MNVVLSLGSNLGDRMGHLRLGLQVLRASLEVTAVSPVYETAPVGGPEQGPYLNAVVLAEAGDAAAALAAAHAAEAAAGRTREVRWGPRTLDVDVIDAGGTVSGDAVLTLPHPRAHERAFVLAPWLDVDPDARLPGYGPVAALLDRLGRHGVVRTGEVLA